MLIKHQYINTACVFYLSNRLDGDGIMKTNGLTVCQGNFETIYISKSTLIRMFLNFCIFRLDLQILDPPPLHLFFTLPYKSRFV